MAEEQVLLVEKPAPFASHPLGYIFFGLLALVSVGVLLFWGEESEDAVIFAAPIAIAMLAVAVIAISYLYVDALTTELTVTNVRTILRWGLLDRTVREVRHSDVRLLEVSQGFDQRMFDVGTVRVASSGHGGIEIECYGVPHPERIKNIIDGQRL